MGVYIKNINYLTNIFIIIGLVCFFVVIGLLEIINGITLPHFPDLKNLIVKMSNVKISCNSFTFF